jgi:hypothetical protein
MSPVCDGNGDDECVSDELSGIFDTPLALLCYDVFMNNSINVNGVSFRLLENGSLLLTTPTGQYQVQPQGVADLFDLLSASQGGFLDATPDQ